MACFFIASSGKGDVVKKQKHFGQVYTPTYLVQDLLDIVGYRAGDAVLEKHVIDNSCGDGAFLDEIVRRYAAGFLEREKDKRTLARQLAQYVHGIEIDTEASVLCKARLDRIASELGLPHVKWDIRNADTLTIADFDGKMDFVVGNPPYVRVHNLAENFEKVKTFKFSTGGMTDLYLVFYEIGLKMLSETGRLCYIAPSSWMNSLAGRAMRNYIRENQCLLGIVDLGHFQPFKATAYTAIVTLCRGNGGSVFDYGVYDGSRKTRHVCSLSYEEAFFSDSLFLGDQQTLGRCREIVKSKVPEYVKVKNGFATLADDVFISDEFTFKEHVIPVLKASTGKWRKAIFPYDRDGKPIARDALFSCTAVADYLLKHKEILLKGRSEASCRDWYLYGRTQALKDVAAEKYAVNTCIRNVASLKLGFVPAGSGVYSGLYILTDVGENMLQKALLVDQFVSYIAALKKYKSGGYYTFSSHDLERYLNYALHRLLSKSKKQPHQSAFDL